MTPNKVSHVWSNSCLVKLLKLIYSKDENASKLILKIPNVCTLNLPDNQNLVVVVVSCFFKNVFFEHFYLTMQSHLSIY
jgi:hypothetical protein